jgi:hypothetical protein
MQFPLLRSYLFWCGIITLGCLVAAWNDSRCIGRAFRLNTNPSWEIESSAGRIKISSLKFTTMASYPGLLDRWDFYTSDPAPRKPTPWLVGFNRSHIEVVNPTEAARSWIGHPHRWKDWSIPYWSIALGVLAIWQALLALRIRHFRRGCRTVINARSHGPVY